METPKADETRPEETIRGSTDAGHESSSHTPENHSLNVTLSNTKDKGVPKGATEYICEALGEQTSAFRDLTDFLKEKINSDRERIQQDRIALEKERKEFEKQLADNENQHEGESICKPGQFSSSKAVVSPPGSLSAIFQSDVGRCVSGNEVGVNSTNIAGAGATAANRERKNEAASTQDSIEDPLDPELQLDGTEEILKDYDDVEDETCTAAVHPVLASRLDKLLSNKQDIKVLKETLNQCPRPQNINYLRNVYVNSEVYSLMGNKLRQFDHAKRSQANMLQKSICPLVKSLDTLIKFEGTLDKSEEGRIVYSETSELNVTELRRSLDKTMQIVSYVFNQITLSRRQAIRAVLDPSYGALCATSLPFTDKLFGDNLEEALNAVSNSNKLKLKAARKNTRTRPYFRSRGAKNFSSPRPVHQTHSRPPRGRMVFHRRGVARRGQGSRPYQQRGRRR